MEKEDKKPLYMPAKIDKNAELLPGITKKEMKPLSILAGISIAIALLVFFLFKKQLGILIGALLITASYFLCMKTKYPIPLTEIIMQAYKYFISQNIYKYKYLDSWREQFEKEKYPK